VSSLLAKTDVWNDILVFLERRLNKHIFDSWFRPIQFEGFDDETGTLHLRAGQVTIDWVSLYYSQLLSQTLTEFGHRDFKIEWSVDPTAKVVENFDDEPEADLYFEVQKTAAAPARFTRQASPSFVDIEPVENSLNQKYTFEKFVVGTSNQFAHAAALAVAESPGKTYNPLFLYGGVGLGKTHLMHAIGHSIKQQNRHLRVSYITSEKFMNELINAIRYDKTQSFRDKYRSIDVLLMDDVQFMAGKERTQEEFFHTFNALHNDQKQIVISSDCPPREIPTLEERLHSRFE